MEAAQAEAEAARQRVGFLADASRILASSLDYATTLQNVAAIPVPTLADASLLDMLRDSNELWRAAESHLPEWAKVAEPPASALRRVVSSGQAALTPTSMLV